MDKFSLSPMSVWQGRQDPEDGELALRWHDKVQAWPLSGTAEPGVALGLQHHDRALHAPGHGRSRRG